MKIRVTFGILAVVLLSFFSGCGEKLPEMSAEQERIIVEYAAQALLHHMKDYESRLVDLSLYAEQAEPDEKKEEGRMDPVADTPVTDIAEAPDDTTETKTETVPLVSPDELLMPEGVELQYTGCRITDHYPEGDAPVFVLNAEQGKALLVMSFTLTNCSDASAKLDLLTAEARGEVVFGGGEKAKVLSTLLLEDLFTFNGELGTGESRELVLVAEIEEDRTEIRDAGLRLYKGTACAEISLQQN